MSENQSTPTTSAANEKELVIVRTFNAPRDLMYKVWTEVEHLEKWWGPKGLTIANAKLDLRPGGMFHYKMVAPDGNEMWGKFVYVEISPPDKLVWLNSFSDPEGNTLRPPFAEEFPLEIKNTVVFTEEDGKTTLTLRGGPVSPTDAELQFFLGMFSSMQQGFAGTFDQLEDYLAKQV